MHSWANTPLWLSSQPLPRNQWSTGWGWRGGVGGSNGSFQECWFFFSTNLPLLGHFVGRKRSPNGLEFCFISSVYVRCLNLAFSLTCNSIEASKKLLFLYAFLPLLRKRQSFSSFWLLKRFFIFGLNLGDVLVPSLSFEYFEVFVVSVFSYRAGI